MSAILVRASNIITKEVFIDEFPAEAITVFESHPKNKASKIVKIHNKEARIAKRENETYLVEALSFDKNYIKSSSLFIREIETVLTATKSIEEKIKVLSEKSEANTGRLIHNLKSLTAKIAQEIYFIALQDKLMGNPKAAIEYLTKEVSKNPKDVAKALISILKYQAAQKTEFSAFHKLNGNVGLLSPELHKIHKVIMSVFYLFFNDFTDKGVKINVEQSEIQGIFDYDSIHVAIYHIIENSAKYIKHGSNMNVSLSEFDKKINITFEMESLTINPDESDKIFLEGYSGEVAKKNSLNGGGVGLYISRKMAELNGGFLTIIPGVRLGYNQDYARNKFVLTLVK